MCTKPGEERKLRKLRIRKGGEMKCGQMETGKYEIKKGNRILLAGSWLLASGWNGNGGKW